MEKRASGFTLAELLISLAILGVIATFTIPKVLYSQQDSQKKAVFKEVIASLYQVCESGVSDGAFSATSTDTAQGTYFLNHLNFVKSCPSNSLTQGCWDASQGDLPYDDIEAGGTFHSGANIAGLGDSGNTGRESATIDWNGITGPNTEGQDQLRIEMCFLKSATTGCFIDAAHEKNPYPSYQVGPFSGASATLWDQIFTP